MHLQIFFEQGVDINTTTSTAYILIAGLHSLTAQTTLEPRETIIVIVQCSSL